MGMFGSGWQKNLATIGATLGDVGGALNHTGGGNLQALQAKRTYDEQQAKREAAMQGIVGMFGQGAPKPPLPVQTPGIVPSYGSDGEAAKAGYRPEITELPGQSAQPAGMPQFDMQKMMAAAAAGVDISPFMKMYEAQRPQYQVANMGDGAFVIDERTGKREWLAEPEGPFTHLKQRKIQAEIDAYEALGTQRESSGRLNDAKTKVGGFAPPRKSGGGGGRSSIGSHGAPEARFKVQK